MSLELPVMPLPAIAEDGPVHLTTVPGVGIPLERKIPVSISEIAARAAREMAELDPARRKNSGGLTAETSLGATGQGPVSDSGRTTPVASLGERSDGPLFVWKKGPGEGLGEEVEFSSVKRSWSRLSHGIWSGVLLAAVSVVLFGFRSAGHHEDSPIIGEVEQETGGRLSPGGGGPVPPPAFRKLTGADLFAVDAVWVKGAFLDPPAEEPASPVGADLGEVTVVNGELGAK